MILDNEIDNVCLFVAHAHTKLYGLLVGSKVRVALKVNATLLSLVSRCMSIVMKEHIL